MAYQQVKKIFLIASLLFICSSIQAQNPIKEQQLRLSLRMIGHRVLLNSGDSISRVLPIEKIGGQYKISFSNKFSFNGEELVIAVDETFREAEINVSYLLEVKDSIGIQTIYSYQKGEIDSTDFIPCQTREQPYANFSIYLTLINLQNPAEPDSLSSGNKDIFGLSRFTIIVSVIIMFTAFSLLFFGFWKRRKNFNGKHLIAIGEYNFNPLNAELTLNNKPVELTSKESDLLILLNENLNETIERDAILEKVWGDQGDYVGRTLDVFISKLRKRLENDVRIKIINVRGVGYKLVINE